MHDRTIEERLRIALRSEADSLPLTVTADELERRLLIRRRERRDRRVGWIAAGIAAFAVGTVFTLAVGPFRTPDVAITPPPTSLPTSPPSSASASPEPTPRVIDPLGNLREAVLLRAIGSDPQRPDSFEVSVFDPVTSGSRVVATFPGTILPTDGWLEGGEGRPTISLSGYIALPFTRGPNVDETHPSILVIDVRSPETAPLILDGYTQPRWGPSEHLAVQRAGSFQVEVYVLPSGFHQPAGNPDGVSVVAWSTGEGTRFIGTRGDAWGAVDFTGKFAPTTDLPPVFARTGAARPIGVAGHTLGMGCDAGPTGGECVLAESRAPGDLVAVWHRASEGTVVGDHLWAVDGRTVLLLLDHGGEQGSQRIEFVHATQPESRISIATVDLPTSGAILGIASEPVPGQPSVAAIGDHDGRVYAFISDRGLVRSIGDTPSDLTPWFLGWADDPEPYDPD